jgi:3-oxoacyl-[acyl-carrier-protein] synthase II
VESEALVITGIGAVTPVGLTADESFAALLRGQSGVVSIDLDDRFQVRIGAPIKNFDPFAILGEKQARRQGRFTQLAVAASTQALLDSGLKDAAYASHRIATIIGVGMGGIEAFYEAAVGLREHGPHHVSPFGIPALVPNMAAAAVAMLAGAEGPCYCTASACASSLHAIGDAMRLLAHGDVDAAIVGGAEACLTPLAVACFARMRALSKRNDEPERASRPFDRDRDGFVIGEGAGVMVVERLAAARRRGANIYAELVGYGASCDAFHETRPTPDGSGARRAIDMALRDAQIAPSDVQYVNAHATSTQRNDAAESMALQSAFGEHARKLWVGGTKSMTGHLLGAAGAVESIITAQVLGTGHVPPTINLDNPDPECVLDYIPGAAREKTIDVAINNSFGFGGQNACVVMRAVERR